MNPLPPDGNEQRLRTLVGSLDDIVFQFDADGRYLEALTARETLLSRPKSELIGRTIADLYGEAFAARFVTVYRRVIETRVPETVEYPLTTIGGETWFSGRVTPVIEPDGTCRTVCVLSRDMTEQKRTADALRDSEHRLRMAMEAANLGMWELNVGTNLTSRWGHELELVGFAGGTQQEFLAAVHPDDRARVDAAVRRAVAERGECAMTFRVVRSDGTVCWIDSRSRFVPCPAGGAGRMVGVTVDVTPHKDAEQALRDANASLRDSERRLRKVFDSDMMGIAFADVLGGTILDANDVFLRLTGYTKADVQSGALNWITMTPPENRERELELARAAMPGGVAPPIEKEFLRKDGTRVPVLAGGAMLEPPGAGAGSDAGRCVAFVLDRTEHRIAADATSRAFASLRQSEDRFRQLVDQLADAIYVFDMDGRFVDVNRRATRDLGYSRDELLRMRVQDIAVVFDAAWQHAAWTRAIEHGEELTLTNRHRRRDGSTYPVEVHVNRIDTGGRRMLLGVSRDVTDRMRDKEALEAAMAALRESEAQHRLLAENSLDMIVRLSPRGEYLYCSPATRQLLGYEPAELLGRNCLELVSPEDAAWMREGFGRSGDCTVTCRVRRKDGSWTWVESKSHLVVDAATGALVEVQSTQRDVNDRVSAARRTARLLERVIGAQEAERRRVARELHDDTGQALTSLLVGLRTLEDVPTLEAARSRARELRGMASRALDDVRRLASGLRPSALDDLGLWAALERYVAEYRQTHGIAVYLEGASGAALDRLPAAVETAVYRIAQEALTNVARHAGAGQVRIAFTGGPARVRMTIEDDGRGFDADAALSTADAALGSADDEGHMGLQSMRERAALLGGTLAVDSVPGDGTTLTLDLPLHGLEEPNHD